MAEGTHNSNPAGLDAFWDRYAFSIGDADFSWIDVGLAAMASGEWSAFERRLSEGVACAARAEAEDAWPSSNVVEEAANTFRYDRDLISGADMDLWLEAAGISIDEWAEYLKRNLLRQPWGDELDDTLDRFAPAVRDLLASVVVDRVCSGAFETLLQHFASRAALVFDTDAGRFQRARAGTATNPSIAAAAGRLAHVHAHWLSTRPPVDLAARLATILEIEDAAAAALDAIASHDRLVRIVEANRLQWIELEIDRIAFPTAAAAQEAVQCVKEDGLPLAEVAALSHGAVERRSVLLEEIDPSQRDLWLAAEVRDVLGPFDADGAFEVTALVARAMPALANPRVAVRARHALVDTALQAAALAHVRRRPPP